MRTMVLARLPKLWRVRLRQLRSLLVRCLQLAHVCKIFVDQLLEPSKTLRCVREGCLGLRQYSQGLIELVLLAKELGKSLIRKGDLKPIGALCPLSPRWVNNNVWPKSVRTLALST